MSRGKVFIVEDESVIASDIAMTLEHAGFEVAGIAGEAADAMARLPAAKPDILLVDIHLQGQMRGTDLVARMRDELNMPVIYITGNSDETTFQLAKATHPDAFLLKPFDMRSLLHSVDLALFNFSEKRDGENRSAEKNEIEDYAAQIHQSLFIRCNGKHKRIAMSDILFVEASGSYCHVVLSRERHTLSKNLNDISEKLIHPSFIRVHRSFIVNLARVDQFDEQFAYIGENQIPISKIHRNDFMTHITRL